MRILHAGNDHVAVALLSRNNHPTEDEIIEFMNGNICRCGCYARIISAIQRAADPVAKTGAAK